MIHENMAEIHLDMGTEEQLRTMSIAFKKWMVLKKKRL